MFGPRRFLSYAMGLLFSGVYAGALALIIVNWLPQVSFEGWPFSWSSPRSNSADANLRSELRQTSDGGQTWQVSASLTSAHFTGFGCSTSGLCLGIGYTWGNKKSANNGSQYKTAIFTIKQGVTGWLAAPVLDTFKDASLSLVDCNDESGCNVAAINSRELNLLSSTDDGQSWSKHQSNLPRKLAELEFYALRCPAARFCILAGEAGIIGVTSDGGDSWTFQTVEANKADFAGLSCASASQCLAVSVRGSLVATNDSGDSWVSDSLDGADSLVAVSCPSGAVCYAASGYKGQVWKISFGSSPNQPLTLKTSVLKNSPVSNYTALSCPDNGTCFALSSTGLLAVTHDGGDSWSKQNLKLESESNFLECPDQQHCYLLTNSY